MKPVSRILPVLLFLSAAFAAAPARAEEQRCTPQAVSLARAQAEEPSTVIARYESWEAIAIRAVMGDFVTSAVPPADAILALYNEASRTVLLIGTELGCTRWHGTFPLDTYERVLRKAVGIPV